MTADPLHPEPGRKRLPDTEGEPDETEEGEDEMEEFEGDVEGEVEAVDHEVRDQALGNRGEEPETRSGDWV